MHGLREFPCSPALFLPHSLVFYSALKGEGWFFTQTEFPGSNRDLTDPEAELAAGTILLRQTLTGAPSMGTEKYRQSLDECEAYGRIVGPGTEKQRDVYGQGSFKVQIDIAAITSGQEAATSASFSGTLEIAKRGKPFTDEEIIKECLIAVVEEIYPVKSREGGVVCDVCSISAGRLFSLLRKNVNSFNLVVVNHANFKGICLESRYRQAVQSPRPTKHVQKKTNPHIRKCRFAISDTHYVAGP
ncbi:hypothetical protein Trydic_g10136 [Trypoxylus dichotomus]